MAKSFYFDILNQYPDVVTEISERLNGKKSLTYSYKQYLVPTFAPDGRWVSIAADYSRVAADIVALNSELPVKSLDAIETNVGYIPKMGLKFALDEKQMKDIDNMLAQNMPTARIVANITQFIPRVIDGVWERNEDLFLSELSTGLGVAENSNGTGLRIDLKHPEKNKFGVAKLWSEADSTPIDDIQKIVDKSIEDQNAIIRAFADDTALNALYKNPQIRAQFAFDNGVATQAGSVVPTLDLGKLQQIFMSKWGIELVRISRSVKTQSNGANKTHSPWKQGVMTFVCDDTLGALMWTTVVEATRPTPGTIYNTIDEYMLVSQYSKNDPVIEYTASQAMVLPVLNNIDRIYILESKTVQA